MKISAAGRINYNQQIRQSQQIRRVNDQLSQNKPQMSYQPTFKSKAAWKGVLGAIIGSVVAGPIGAILLGGTAAGYGAIEDSLDEDKKNGIDWDKMPDLA